MTENMKIARLAAIAAIFAALIAAVITPIVTHLVESYSKEKPEAKTTKKVASLETQAKINSAPKPVEKAEPAPKIGPPDSELGSIFIGMSKPYVETLFGTPIVELEHDFDSSTETNYVFDKFYLQFIFSKSGSLQFYSVVSRKNLLFHAYLQ
ncbi:ETEC_3214 domain-containing protein [Pseudomonas syringae]|uniref:ETEC_3214 domain-containing protein n=1 Tax=Pseudomonas syringae TaxID=317 RepID=UPI003F74F487